MHTKTFTICSLKVVVTLLVIFNVSNGNGMEEGVRTIYYSILVPSTILDLCYLQTNHLKT